MRPFYTLDVFTHERFAGNPLAVVLNAEGLSTTNMQRIAAEFNLSETVFILPEKIDGIRASIRIFTPGTELPFAGHPTVGTAVLLATLDGLKAEQTSSFTLRLSAGDTPCQVSADVQGRISASFIAPKLPIDYGVVPSSALLAQSLGLKATDLRHDNHAPVHFGAPSSFVFVPLKSADDLSRIDLDVGAMKQAFNSLSTAHPALYAYGMGGLDGGDVRARMFGPLMGITEDPATGSAAVSLCGALFKTEPWDGERLITIEQGYEMGRPSCIQLKAEAKGGSLQRITVSGGAIVISKGELL